MFCFASTASQPLWIARVLGDQSLLCAGENTSRLIERWDELDDAVKTEIAELRRHW